MHNLKRLLALMSFLFFVSSANATYISASGTEYSLDGDIVTATSSESTLQWLRWWNTDNYSVSDIYSILDTYGSLYLDGVDYGTGWTLASTEQMATLFNDFFSEATGYTWGSDENSYYRYSTDEDIGVENFFDLIGVTYYEVDAIDISFVLYGTDEDGDGNYNFAEVLASIHNDAYSKSTIYLFSDNFSSMSSTADDYDHWWGIALVRSVDTVTVPEPKPIGLVFFGLLLLGFATWRRNVFS